MDYFLMSFRFNKQHPQDFGLIYKDGKFIRENDDTEWIPCQLFDLGWGEENGFYKVPLGTFDQLMQLVLCGDDLEDSYGAAAMIQSVYPEELKVYLLNLICQKNLQDRNKLRKLNQFFQLHRGINLTFQTGISMAEVDKENADWQKIATFFSSK